MLENCKPLSTSTPRFPQARPSTHKFHLDASPIADRDRIKEKRNVDMPDTNSVEARDTEENVSQETVDSGNGPTEIKEMPSNPNETTNEFPFMINNNETSNCEVLLAPTNSTTTNYDVSSVLANDNIKYHNVPNSSLKKISNNYEILSPYYLNNNKIPESANNTSDAFKSCSKASNNYRTQVHNSSKVQESETTNFTSETDIVESRRFNGMKKIVVTPGIILIVAVVLCCMATDSKNDQITVDELFNEAKNMFKNQGEDFWITIENSIKEIKTFKQPRTLLFVYEKETDESVNKILEMISKIAVCSLTDCSKKSVVISGTFLNTTLFLEDYGKVIVTYKDRLMENGVFIVKNLDKVPGTVAQAFHSFCDEYNPIVQRALFLFTIGVDKYNEENLVKFVENYLLKQWSDLPIDDKFYPLFARISSMIMLVKSEEPNII